MFNTGCTGLVDSKGLSERFRCFALIAATVIYANCEHLSLVFIFLGFSHFQLNLRSKNWYRIYNKNIPEWLHNRPKKYVQHCLEKMELSKEVNINNLFKSERFTVTSSANPKKFKEIFLGDNLRIPSCHCFKKRKK